MEKLIEEINGKIKENNKILCRDALQIAHDLNISPAAVGKELNTMKIKIMGCQLGCFK